MKPRLIRGALLTAALAVLSLATPAPADNPPPATGDVLVATRGAVPGIVLINALGGQTQIATLVGLEYIGAFPSSIAYPGDGFIYATIDNALNDASDAIVRIDPTTGDIVKLVDQTTAAGQLQSPTGIDIDPATGDIIFTQGGQLMRADPGTGAVSVVAEFDLLGNLQEVVVDATGAFAYVVDDATDGVVRVALSNGAQTRVVINQPTVVDTIFLPLDLVLDGTDVVAVSMINGLTRFDLGSGKGEDVLRAPATGEVAPGAAQGVDIDPSGNFVIVDSNATTVYRVNPDGSGSVISSGGLIFFPQDVVVVGGASQSTGGSIGGGGGGGGNDCPLCSLTGDLDGKAKVKVKKVGKGKSEMDFSIVFDGAASTWTATVDGKQISGTSAPNKKGTKALLTPDAESIDTLLDIVLSRLDAADPQPVLLLSRPPKLVFKTNKKANKGVLSIAMKIETDIGAKTYKGSLKAKLKGGATGR